MTSQETALEEVRERLTKLERENRRLKQIGAGALIGAASLFVMGQAPSRKAVEASEFILRDANNNVRARLSVDDKSASAKFVLLGKEGREIIKLDSGVPGWGGSLTLANGQGETRVYLSSFPDFGAIKGGGGIMLYGNDKEFLNLAPTMLGFADSDGVVETSLGQSEFIRRDSSGNIRARLFMSEKGMTKMNVPGIGNPVPVTFNPSPVLALYDEKGKREVVVSGGGALGGYVSAKLFDVEDSDGQTRGSFFAVSDYGAMVNLDNAKGDQRVFIEPGHLEVSDDEGFKAGLGVEKNLVTPRTGETHKTSAASLLLFDKDKKVIWKAP
jgi:hypothetical protein